MDGVPCPFPFGATVGQGDPCKFIAGLSRLDPHSPLITSGLMSSRVFRSYGLPQSFHSYGSSCLPNKNIGSMATTSTCPSDSEWTFCQGVQTKQCWLSPKYPTWLNGNRCNYAMAASVTPNSFAGVPLSNSNCDSTKPIRQITMMHGYTVQPTRPSLARRIGR